MRKTTATISENRGHRRMVRLIPANAPADNSRFPLIPLSILFLAIKIEAVMIIHCKYQLAGLAGCRVH